MMNFEIVEPSCGGPRCRRRYCRTVVCPTCGAGFYTHSPTKIYCDYGCYMFRAGQSRQKPKHCGCRSRPMSGQTHGGTCRLSWWETMSARLRLEPEIVFVDDDGNEISPPNEQEPQPSWPCLRLVWSAPSPARTASSRR